MTLSRRDLLALDVANQQRGVEIVNVRRITSVPTSTDWLRSHTVDAETLSAPSRLVQYTTVNKYLAELCDWGRQAEWPLEIAWRQSAFGREIVSVKRAVRR
jgi:hypothetical protein